METEPKLENGNHEALIGELKTILEKALREDMDNVSERISEFVNGKPKNEVTGEEAVVGLKEKYPDYAEYRMYHVVTFSGMIREPNFFDFPGDDSVEAFIRSL